MAGVLGPVGYSREDASWIAEDITNTAIRSPVKQNTEWYSVPCLLRSFINHSPERAILDSVSALLDGVTHSLRVSVVRSTRFLVEFQMDVFKLLFDGKGERATDVDTYISWQTLTKSTLLLVGINVGIGWAIAAKWTFRYSCIQK